MIGIDIVDVARITTAVEKHGERFLERVFTENEIAYARTKRHIGETLAGRFAAKEAFIKAQGESIPWKEIEVCREGDRPFIIYKGKRYDSVSISHERAYAVAMVIV